MSQPASMSISQWSRIQGPVQGWLAPASHLGQFIPFGWNSYSKTFVVSTPPAEASSRFLEAFFALPKEELHGMMIKAYEVTKNQVSDDGRSAALRLNTWTAREWLDVLDMRFRRTSDTTTEVRVSFFATGIIPTKVPFALPINALLFFVPFSSPDPINGGLLQPKRVATMEKLCRAA